MIKTIPLAPIFEVGLTELIDKDDQVDQNDYSQSVALTVGGGDGTTPTSGELLSLVLISTELGTGSVQTPAGNLIFFDADPAVTAGDTALTAAEWQSVIGVVEVEADDWAAADGGGAAVFKEIAIPYHELATIYAVWDHLDATSLNDAAGDDEELHLNVWLRRDS